MINIRTGPCRYLNTELTEKIFCEKNFRKNRKRPGYPCAISGPVSFRNDQRLSVCFVLLFALSSRNNDRACGVACDIDCRASHIKDTVNACDKRDALDRKSYGLEDHGEHDHSCASEPRTDGPFSPTMGQRRQNTPIGKSLRIISI